MTDNAVLRQKLQAAERLLAARRARDSLIAFTRFTMPDPDEPDNVEASIYSVQAHHRVLAEALEKAENGMLLAEGHNILCISVGPQKGKALHVDAKIPTPSGYCRMGDLQVGDWVFDDQGRPTRVVAVSEVWQDRELFDVMTDDGDCITVDAEHEWLVRMKRGYDVLKVKTTAELYRRQESMTDFRAPMVRAQGALQMPEVTLPVDPYVLGVWLGDGNSASSGMCSADRQIIDEVQKAEGECNFYQAVNGCMHFRAGPHYRRGSAKDATLQARLRMLGLLKNKHVPPTYLRASEAQRRALLQGLVDTDGYVAPNGQVEFCSTREILAKNVKELVASLGGKASIHVERATLYGRDCGPKYRVRFFMAEAARLERKRKNCRTGKKSTRRYITIRPSGRGPTKCIQVAAESHLFLCGESMIPTHNSELVSRRFPAWMEGRRPTRNFMLGAYNDDFAREFGDDVRNVMSTKEYAQVFPKVRLRKGSKSKDHMITEHGGKMSFFGRGGSATGRPADIFIIDDPIKNQEEAASLTIRNTVWNWFTKVVQTRCHGQSVIIIVQTRWHEDDLIGRLTDKTSTYYDEEMAKKVMYINLPSIVEDAALAKALGVPVGGSIWEERFPLEMLKLRMRIDPSGFNAMEMGRPTPPEGSFYKVHQIRACRYKSLDELPRNLRKYGAGDLAVSDATKADSSVVGDWGLDEHDVLWLLPDLYWEKKKADESVDKLVSMGKDNWMTFFGEKGQIARAIGPFLEKRMQEENAYFHIETFPNVNKGQAALSFRGRLAQRKVRFPAFAEWWPRAEEQMLKFTGSGDDKEDDFVDMCSRIGQGIPMQVSASRQKKPEDNVVRIGSMAWIKNQHKHQERRKKRRAAVMGM